MGTVNAGGDGGCSSAYDGLVDDGFEQGEREMRQRDRVEDGTGDAGRDPRTTSTGGGLTVFRK